MQPVEQNMRRQPTREQPAQEHDDEEVTSLEGLFEMALDLSCIADPNGELRRVNAAFESLGYTPAELRSHCLLELVHPEDREFTLDEYTRLSTSEPKVTLENRIRCKDGSYRWIAWTCCRAPSGTVLSVGRDITRVREAIKAECESLHEELNTQKHQYQAIFDTLPQMIWLKDTNNRLIRANAAAARSMGMSPSEVEGRSEYEFHPRQADKYYGDDLEIMHGAKPKLDIIETYETGPDELRWVRTDKTPYLDEAGNVVGIVVSATDVTGWKRGEQERARLYEQLKQLDESKSRFFANVSHELRTPLTLILGPVDKLLREGTFDEEQRRELEVVRRNARALLKHVNDLLDIAKLDAGKVNLRLAPLDVDELVRATAAQFESVARERQLAIVLDSPGPVAGCGDAENLQRVIGNVLANAFRFTPDGGTIRCSVRVDDDAPERRRVTIEIADSGTGIEASMREAIFERFRQADGALAGRRGGTGLGLAIANELVALHHGTIRAGSAPEGGALFTIQIPLAPLPDAVHGSATNGGRLAPFDRTASPPAPPTFDCEERATVQRIDDAGAAAPRPSPRETPGIDRPLVLVVEDHPEMNRFVARELSAEYRVLSAHDGEEGLRIARTTKPDLIVSDVMMPKADGLWLLRALRADEALGTVPLVLLTARADEPTMVSALTGGADDYLTKPFSARELRARVRAHLELARMRRECIKREEETNQLRATIQSRDEFLSIASHELRTPLSTLQLNLQMLARLPEHAEELRNDRLAVATRACKQMSTLINTLLDVARIATGHMELDKSELDLRELLQELARRFEGEAAASGSTLELRLDGPAVGCWDRLRIEQVVSNLLGNAIKFGSGKPIELGCTVDAECVHVTVRDHGVGISPGDQDRIFKRFEQAVSARSYGGLGLGLWIANDIVCRHGGVIHLESTPGAGTTFTVDLPRAVRGLR